MLHAKVTLTLSGEALLVGYHSVWLCFYECVDIWGKVMNYVTEKDNFFIHFGIEERLCLWRGL